MYLNNLSLPSPIAPVSLLEFYSALHLFICFGLNME